MTGSCFAPRHSANRFKEGIYKDDPVLGILLDIEETGPAGYCPTASVEDVIASISERRLSGIEIDKR